MQNDKILIFFAQYIESELGIIYSKDNYFQLQNRLEEIAKTLSLGGLEVLFEHAQKGIDGQFKQLLLDIATNNETSFFRDANVFKAVESRVLPELLDALRPARPLRIWSAASSTGQEALSIAMLIREWSEKSSRKVQFHISGTDISERVLAKAKSGNYSQLEVQRGLSDTLMKRYFTKDLNERWTAVDSLRQDISFKSLNLKKPFFFQDKFDIVFCRNVLIYQNLEGKKDILKRVTAALEPGGYLVMGSGESLVGLSTDFQTVPVENAVIYRKISSAASAA